MTVEVPSLQALALASLGDAAFALAHIPANSLDEGGIDPQSAAEASEQLSISLSLLGATLYAPNVQLQYIAALSLSKIVLGASDALGVPKAAAPKSRPAQRPPARAVGMRAHKVRIAEGE